MALCERCKDAPALKHAKVCGICEIVLAKERGEKVRWGLQTPGLVPGHFNHGLGVYVEDRDDLNRKRQEAKRQGIVSNWE